MSRRRKNADKQNTNLQEITIKRTRVPNFTVEEKSVLTKLVNKRKDVIESKATDTKSIIKKKEAWLLIEKEFNRVINVYKRDHSVLKTAWDNIKAQTRKIQLAKSDKKTESKSPAKPSPILKETILRMVEEVACSDTNERPQDIKRESYSFIKQCNSDININKPARLSLSDELNNDVHSGYKTLKDKHSSTEQSDTVLTYSQTSHKEISHLCIQIEFEREDSSPIKSENETIEDILLHTTTTNDDPVHKEADLLNSLKLKNNADHQILKAKLHTALLEQQAAKINLEKAKLDLALLTKRLKN